MAKVGTQNENIQIDTGTQGQTGQAFNMDENGMLGNHRKHKENFFFTLKKTNNTLDYVNPLNDQLSACESKFGRNYYLKEGREFDPQTLPTPYCWEENQKTFPLLMFDYFDGYPKRKIK